VRCYRDAHYWDDSLSESSLRDLGARGMRRLLKPALLTVALCTVALAAANKGLVHLSSFPTIAVADGKSTISIDAEIRDTNGKLVPDGTRVIFTTDLGHFRESVVATQNGIAHTVLVAAASAGIAKVSASAMSYQATATLEYQFVGDRSLLSSAKEYIEVVGEKDVRYSYESKVLTASGPKRTAYLRYREIEIHADDLQVNVSTCEVRAKNAVLKIGKSENEFRQLYFKLNDRHGYGLTTYKHQTLGVAPDGRVLQFVPGVDDQSSFGVAEITAGGLQEPASAVNPDIYDFEDLSDSTTEIAAKKVTAFPNRLIQFERADVEMQGSKLLKMPLYQLDMNNQGRLFDNILNVNNNQLSINYPYYLSLKPGVTSLLRLRTGQSDGRGLAANRGLFLDYEYNWNRGDDMQGALTFQGLGRSDWGVGANQYWRFGEGSSIAATFDVPSHRSLFGTINGSKQFKGYDLNIDASAGRTFAGTPFSSDQYSVTLERDPIKMGHLPVQLFLGAEAFSTATRTTGFIANNDPTNPELLQTNLADSQTAYGLRLRAQSDPLKLGPTTGLSASLAMSKLQGHNTLSGLTYVGSATLSHTFAQSVGLTLTYDYLEDGFNSTLLGRHQLSLQAFYNKGNVLFNFYGQKGLDAERFAYQLDASYRLSPIWRLGYSLTAQRYLGDSYTDYTLVLGCRVGFKEVGLTWSQKTHRVGFQVLGTTFN
jgi:hypothetical protein